MAFDFTITYLKQETTTERKKKQKEAIGNKLITNPWMSMLSTSPEKEKNSLISCSVAPEERLPTFTDLICR